MNKVAVVFVVGFLTMMSVTAAKAQVPAAPVALQATGVTGTGFTAHWTPSDGATGYRIDIAILDDFIARSFDLGIRDSLITGGTASSFVATGLHPTYTYYYRVRAVNDSGRSTNSNIITVLHITTEFPLPSATVGVLYSERLSAVGGTLPYTNWTVIGGSLPAGLALNPATGVISGTPTDTGRVDCTIQVTDNAAVMFSKPFELDVVKTPTIALDTIITRNNGSPTFSMTWSHPIGSGSNRMLIVSVGGEETGPVTNLPISSVTYGGIPLARAIFQDVSSNEYGIGPQSNRTEIWYLLEKDLPSPGSYTVLVTFTGKVDGAGAGSMSLKNVKQGPPEASASDSVGMKNKLTSHITVLTDNSWLVGSAIVGYVGRFAPVDHQGERFQLDLNIADMLGVTKQIHGAGPDSMVVYHPLYNRMAQAVISIAPAPIVVQPKVFLQGPFASGGMSTDLRTSGALATHFTTAAIPMNAVDSITVEIRDSLTAATSRVRMFSPAWLLADGTLRGFADTTKGYAEFSGAPIGNYYIVVRHRNHLSIMSSRPVRLSSTGGSYDFTTAQDSAFTQVPGFDAMAPLTGGVFGMFSGDVNGSGVVNASDRGYAWNERGLESYQASDVDLSGVCNASDRGIVWNNRGTESQVP